MATRLNTCEDVRAAHTVVSFIFVHSRWMLLRLAVGRSRFFVCFCCLVCSRVGPGLAHVLTWLCLLLSVCVLSTSFAAALRERRGKDELEFSSQTKSDEAQLPALKIPEQAPRSSQITSGSASSANGHTASPLSGNATTVAATPTVGGTLTGPGGGSGSGTVEPSGPAPLPVGSPQAVLSRLIAITAGEAAPGALHLQAFVRSEVCKGLWLHAERSRTPSGDDGPAEGEHRYIAVAIAVASVQLYRTLQPLQSLAGRGPQGPHPPIFARAQTGSAVALGAQLGLVAVFCRIRLVGLQLACEHRQPGTWLQGPADCGGTR